MKQLLEFGTHCPQTHALSYESYCGCCCSFGGGLGVGHLKITAPNRFLVFRILRKYSFLSLELNHKKAESPDFSFLENFCQIFLLFKTRLALLFVLVTWQPWLYLIPCNHSPQLPCLPPLSSLEKNIGFLTIIELLTDVGLKKNLLNF